MVRAREGNSLRWLWLSAIVVGLDQLSKYLAVSYLTLHEPVPVMPFINFTLIYNPGAAFSFLSDKGGWQRWLFIVLAIVVVVFLVLWLRKIPRGRIWLPFALALVLGGAIGNLWDRVVIGEVVDFLDVYYDRWHWPAFNVADSAISVGAVMLLISAFFPEERATGDESTSTS